MNFYTNLRRIITILGCKNIELAEVSNLDHTIISKFKNNIRIPTIGSKQFDSLINGIAILTIRKNKIIEINNICGTDSNLYRNIYNYLINNSSDIRLNKNDSSIIGVNLDKIMKTFNISNVMIAKFINKDSSLISKYKTGKRYILKNDFIVNQICDFIEKHIVKYNLQEDAYLLFNISQKDNLYETIFSYLFTIQKENSPINKLLESINNFEYDITKSIPSIESLVPNKIIYSNKTYYIGTIEFRIAIKKLLSNVALSDKPTTLYLYSDENMKWLFQNKDFYNSWKYLMINCLFKKNKIKIVHNINRTLNEMFKAIESWLPLYMTGLIDPYYNLKNNNNFTHTLFIADDISVISSSSIICNKDCNIYNYSVNKNIINNYKKQYLQLLNNSENLLKIYVGNELKEKIKNKQMYFEYSQKNLENILIMLKKDETEILILKTNSQKILFEFKYSKMIDIFKKYIDNKKLNKY